MKWWVWTAILFSVYVAGLVRLVDYWDSSTSDAAATTGQRVQSQSGGSRFTATDDVKTIVVTDTETGCQYLVIKRVYSNETYGAAVMPHTCAADKPAVGH